MRADREFNALFMAIEQTAEAIAPSTTKIEMISMLMYVKMEIWRVATSQCLVIARVNTRTKVFMLYKCHPHIPQVNSCAKKWRREYSGE